MLSVVGVVRWAQWFSKKPPFRFKTRWLAKKPTSSVFSLLSLLRIEDIFSLTNKGDPIFYDGSFFYRFSTFCEKVEVWILCKTLLWIPFIWPLRLAVWQFEMPLWGFTYTKYYYHHSLCWFTFEILTKKPWRPCWITRTNLSKSD